MRRDRTLDRTGTSSRYFFTTRITKKDAVPVTSGYASHIHLDDVVVSVEGTINATGAVDAELTITKLPTSVVDRPVIKGGKGVAQEIAARDPEGIRRLTECIARSFTGHG
ncbi:MAG: hypothetical protein ACP5UR_15240 [Chloroflexus sp.]|uniref:hypothetical protein n=1 Tax=Chloroflexus sp. TaxID=1904827 RepID=UPI003C788581